eukprot:EG_transcript_12759
MGKCCKSEKESLLASSFPLLAAVLTSSTQIQGLALWRQSVVDGFLHPIQARTAPAIQQLLAPCGAQLRHWCAQSQFGRRPVQLSLLLVLPWAFSLWFPAMVLGLVLSLPLTAPCAMACALWWAVPKVVRVCSMRKPPRVLAP